MVLGRGVRDVNKLRHAEGKYALGVWDAPESEIPVEKTSAIARSRKNWDWVKAYQTILLA